MAHEERLVSMAITTAMTTAIRRWLGGSSPAIFLVLLILSSLFLMSEATQNSARFGELYLLLFLANALAILFLAFLISWKLFSLLRQVRQRVGGAQLTMRLVAMFMLLSLTPVIVLYAFSLQFLQRGIDSWFDVRIENALESSLELSRSALDNRMRERLKQTKLMAEELSLAPREFIAGQLNEVRRRRDASELVLMATAQQVIAMSSADPTAILPHLPEEAILLQLRQTGRYMGLDPIADVGLHIRVILPLPNASTTENALLLQALFPVTPRLNELANEVQSAFAQYRELAYLRKPLKLSFILTLSLVLLLSVLGAIWAAFYSAHRLVAPLRDLARGTRAVAGGDYGTRLPGSGSDEIGFLVDSFNDMTAKLGRARDETRLSQQQVEEQRSYLEAILSHMSAGVLTLDQQGQLHTANQRAGQILDLELRGQEGLSLTALAQRYPHIVGLVESVQEKLEARSADWSEEIILQGESARQVLMCRGTPLTSVDGPSPGHVIVFEDITALVQAQRNAAWSEVARRLAHEIKNPLTPIQLSAERLRQKYLPILEEEQGATLDRLTHTIVQQVEALKGMVNAFSSYARSPQSHPCTLDLGSLVNDVTELYRSNRAGTTVHCHIEKDLPLIEADPDRLRQVLHNLVRNALEADTNNDATEISIEVERYAHNNQVGVELRVRDQGSGFSEDLLAQAFEPYVTTKTKGNGLGLAIVKKIVEENGGMVWAENNSEGGASIVLRFPLSHLTTKLKAEA